MGSERACLITQSMCTCFYFFLFYERTGASESTVAIVTPLFFNGSFK